MLAEGDLNPQDLCSSAHLCNDTSLPPLSLLKEGWGKQALPGAREMSVRGRGREGVRGEGGRREGGRREGNQTVFLAVVGHTS